jgi:peptidyl-dipeptidase Dcp
MSTSFSHIFQGGYSSDITVTNGPKFDADAFISRKGIFKRSTKFKDNVLSKGGTELPMELYKIQRSRTKSGCIVETCWVDIDQC